MKVLCLTDSDTRMKWAIRIAEQVMSDSTDQASCSEIVVASFGDGALPSARQLDELGVLGAHLAITDADLPNLLGADVDVLVVNTVGSRLHRVVTELRRSAEGRQRRPVLVTGYAGLVYEKHVEGAVWRSAADVVCCNSHRDLRRFGDIYRSLGVDAGNLVQTGFAVIDDTGGAVPLVDRASLPPRTVTFAVQPDVPRSARDRSYVAQRLVDYALAHPDRTVIVKLRSRPDELTTHREVHRYDTLIERLPDGVPANLGFEYGLMSDVLDRTDLLLTISSTAAIEALARGLAVGIISDLGVGESLGIHPFLGSGLLATFDDLIADRVPAADPEWMVDNGFGPDDRRANVAITVRQLLDQQRNSGRALPIRGGVVSSFTTPHLDRWASEHGASGERASPSVTATRRLVRRCVPHRVRARMRRLILERAE